MKPIMELTAHRAADQIVLISPVITRLGIVKYMSSLSRSLIPVIYIRSSVEALQLSS